MYCAKDSPCKSNMLLVVPSREKTIVDVMVPVVDNT